MLRNRVKKPLRKVSSRCRMVTDWACQRCVDTVKSSGNSYGYRSMLFDETERVRTWLMETDTGQVDAVGSANGAWHVKCRAGPTRQNPQLRQTFVSAMCSARGGERKLGRRRE